MENVRFIDNEEECFYKDNFKIRCWDREVILNEFEISELLSFKKIIKYVEKNES
jgi:hypothetical protein